MTTKTVASVGLAMILSAIVATDAQARSRYRHRQPSTLSYGYNVQADWGSGWHLNNSSKWGLAKPTTKRHYRTAKRHYSRHYRAVSKKKRRPAPPATSRRFASHRGEVQIMPHPVGCPRTSFCGCGVAVHVFGKPIRDLWLARNWFKFPSAAPAPGRVAVRRHHVFAILKDLGNGRVLAYDPNSGGHKTRIHVRRLAGYRVVDPGQNKAWAYAG